MGGSSLNEEQEGELFISDVELMDLFIVCIRDANFGLSEVNRGNHWINSSVPSVRR